MTNQPNGVATQAPESNVNVEELSTLLTKYLEDGTQGNGGNHESKSDNGFN